MSQILAENILGQTVDVSNPYTASGYYLFTDETIAEQGISNCPEGMRPGVMIIRGAGEGRIPTCGGRIVQENLPDIHVVDWRYRIYVQLLLLALVLIMVVAIGLKLWK